MAETLLTVEEARRKLGVSRRKLAFLVRRDLIEPATSEGETLRFALAEIDRFLGLPATEQVAAHESYWRTLGPGLITGASDDDPSGVGTYSQVGAAYGLTFTWLAPYLLPLMFAIQEISARIGIVTGTGLSRVISNRYGRRVLLPLVLLLLVANTFNIGADIAAMAESLRLLVPVNFYLAAIVFTVGMLVLEIAFSYRRYSRVLKWLALSLLAYVLTSFVVRPDWIAVLTSVAIPHVRLDSGFIAAMVAVMGTTISPYLFFWQASEEVEEETPVTRGELPEHRRIAIRAEIRHMRTDTWTGMGVSQLVMLFIIVTTAAVLHAHGLTNINSAQEAAVALRPLAGRFAELLFALGIIGTGLLAVPVLAGSSAYALAELLRWHEGLSKVYSNARGFYGIIIASMFVGFVVTTFGVNPIRALYYAAILNGVAAPALMFFIVRLGRDPKVMGAFTNPRWVSVAGWIATALMGAAAIALIGLTISGH